MLSSRRSDTLKCSRSLVAAALLASLWGCGGRVGLDHAEPMFVEQRVASAVTVLLVIDNSGDMCQEQEALRAALPGLVADLTGTGAPFHIGVITGDTIGANESGRLQNVPRPASETTLCPKPPPVLDCTTGLPNPLPKFVDNDTPMLDQVLACNASVGISGFYGQTALGAIHMALSAALLEDPTANAGFVLEGSLVTAIVLSTIEDCSVCSGSTCSPVLSLTSDLDCDLTRTNEATPPEELVEAFRSTPGAADTLAFAIIGLDPITGTTIEPATDEAGDPVPICKGPGGWATSAPRVESFALLVPEGETHSICADSLEETLSNIGSSIRTRVGTSSVCLQSVPCESGAAAIPCRAKWIDLGCRVGPRSGLQPRGQRGLRFGCFPGAPGTSRRTRNTVHHLRGAAWMLMRSTPDSWARISWRRRISTATRT